MTVATGRSNGSAKSCTFVRPLSAVGLNEMKPNISLRHLLSHPHNPMLPDAALTLGLVAGTNVLVFCESPRELCLMCLPLHWHVGNASAHPTPVMLGSFRLIPY